MSYERKLDTRDELLQRILDTARQVNNAAILHKVTCSLVKKPGCAPKLMANVFKLHKICGTNGEGVHTGYWWEGQKKRNN
jgi:hypothetical protein